MKFKLTEADAGTYLEDQGIIGTGEKTDSSQLGGGVSNTVIQVETSSDCYVIKQPLKNLDVEDDWPADVGRIHNEASATRTFNQIATTIDRAHSPQVIHECHDSNIVVFSCVPSETVIWKSNLLDGVVGDHIAEIIGRLLGKVHYNTRNDSVLQQEFNDKAPFEQLRIDPYHRTVAKRHPDVAPIINTEIDRILEVDTTLVHGDYSPKNFLISEQSPPSVWVLDFEVAHWGDPSFDTAFLMNHLFIKSVYVDDRSQEFISAVESFWQSYNDIVSWDIEGETMTELGILMLARIDGKSPVEYIQSGSTADVLRRIAIQILEEDVSDLNRCVEIVKTESDNNE